jgi:hypothetical protein
MWLSGGGKYDSAADSAAGGFSGADFAGLAFCAGSMHSPVHEKTEARWICR